MSNLGAYQWMTATAKKVGGPVNFMILIAGVGAATYKVAEVTVVSAAKGVKKLIEANQYYVITEEKIYIITSDDKTNKAVKFKAGDQFKILQSDGDAVLVEKIGDKNNPYFVSAKLLRKISDYDQ